jgi:hypothetical protein
VLGKRPVRYDLGLPLVLQSDAGTHRAALVGARAGAAPQGSISTDQPEERDDERLRSDCPTGSGNTTGTFSEPDLTSRRRHEADPFRTCA